jgi:hypothetical protein
MDDRGAGLRGIDGALGDLLGLRGTCGLRSWVPPEPVTAQVMKTSRFMVRGIWRWPEARC